MQLPARSYDPTYGRFTTPGPRPDAAAAANSSTYAYSNNDPANQSDPSGACPLCVSAGIGAVIGAAVEGGIYSWKHRNGGFTAGGFGTALGKGALIGGVSGLLMPGAGNLAARGLGLTGALPCRFQCSQRRRRSWLLLCSQQGQLSAHRPLGPPHRSSRWRWQQPDKPRNQLAEEPLGTQDDRSPFSSTPAPL
ncbi:RHS repeat-associated core domain-containing protein [Streptomyces sp. NPDC059496]|uniref:RHS repeat-associated core domain-containing protein n=1 Tax=Streptomyces sp. NPDC059496 TaxID=3346851 RepID=UPI0036AC75CE